MLSKTIDRNTLALEPETSRGYLADVLVHVGVIKDYYPNFEPWIAEKVIPNLLMGNRSILVEYRAGRLAGFAILKDDEFEQKICSLRILPDFQNYYGLGIRLFERSFQELGTNTPLLSVAEEGLPSFQKMFDYFGFELAESYLGHYRTGRIEHAFNGLLKSDGNAFKSDASLHQKKSFSQKVNLSVT